MAKDFDKNTESPKGSKVRVWRTVYILTILLLLTVAIGGIYARYVYSKVNTGTVHGKEFYFTSGQLSQSVPEYTLSAGTTSVTVTLQNFADSIRVTEGDIAYTVTVDNGASVTDGTGTITGGAQRTASVTITGLVDGKTYTVTAVGSGGYKETLSATFTVMTANKVYKHLDTISNPAYVVLTVWTENVSGNASITFPAGLIPDGTDPALSGIVNYVSSGTPYEYQSGSFVDSSNFTSAYASHQYRFFKERIGDSYTLGDFTTVSVNGIAATEATP